jgi:glucose/arabinose dehydrogenase
VQVFASGLDMPRRMQVAPNGDVFLSESGAGRVLVFRASAGEATARPEVFAQDLDRPYGIAFVPPDEPRFVFVAAANQVVRYPYRTGDVKATGPAEVVIADIPTKRHWTRDLAVTRDGKRLFVSIGSASNLGVGGMPAMPPDALRKHEATHGRGAITSVRTSSPIS